MNFKDIPQYCKDGHYQVNTCLDMFEHDIQRYIDEYGLILNPDFQRGHVWTRNQQIAFVEYFLKGGRSGRILYFNHPQWMLWRSKKGEYSDFVVVDGLQRITALLAFVRGELPAFGYYVRTEKNPPDAHCFEGKLKWLECNSNLIININNLPTRAKVLEWYLQMNSGGTPHTEAELQKVRVLLQAEQAEQAEH